MLATTIPSVEQKQPLAMTKKTEGKQLLELLSKSLG